MGSIEDLRHWMGRFEEGAVAREPPRRCDDYGLAPAQQRVGPRCRLASIAVRVWFDITAPAHPLVFRPIIERMRQAGHEIHVTARDYAQTLELLDSHGIAYVALGRHGGSSRVGKLAALIGRTVGMHRRGRGGFDLAVAHGSNDLALAAASLRIPEVNTFDYEFAVQQHRIGCRLARRVLTPDAIPRERLARFGASGSKLVQYPGLKEEYYLSDFEPDRSVPERLGVDRNRVVIVIRPPPDVSLYHRKANRLFPQVLRHLAVRDEVQAVVVPRTDAQRSEVRRLYPDTFVVPDGAVDTQSLIALADLVVSAGGTMNREAVALGTPVYTTYGGRLGGVDEQLIRDGRLRPLTDARAIDVVKRSSYPGVTRNGRDPGVLVDLILGAV